MDRDSSVLLSRIEQLEATLRGIQGRIEALETDRLSTPAEEATAQDIPIGEVRRRSGGSRQSALPLIGQTLLILGGAFLPRWLTETGTIPAVGGTVLGLAYAGIWIGVAGRAASGGNTMSPGFRGLAAALIGFPLVWEATTKFGFLPAHFGAVALAVMIGCSLYVAWRWAIRPLAWTMVLAALPTTVGLAFATKLFVPYLGLLLLVGLAALWLGYFLRWTFLAWVTAFVTNVVFVLVAIFRMSEPLPPIVDTLEIGSLVLLLLGLIVVYFGSVVTRTLVRGRDTTVLEIGQSLTVLGIGLAGSFGLGRNDPTLQAVIGSFALVLALGCYAAAFTFIDRRLGRGRNFVYFSSLGLALLLVASFVLLRGHVAAAALALVAALSAWVGGRWGRATLSLHGAIYLVAGAFCSGVFALAGDAFLGPTIAAFESIPRTHFLVLAVAALCSSLHISTEGSPWGQFARVTRVADLAVLLIALGGLAIMVIGIALPQSVEGVHDRGALATSRAAVLAISTVVLAWASRSRRFAESFWFVYPLLAAGGAKILLEDLRVGHSLTLFASLTFFGLALIVAPRLARKPGTATLGTAMEDSRA